MVKKKKQSKKTIIKLIIFSAIIISLYFFIRTRTTPYTTSVSQKSEPEKLITKDIAGNYPSTPKEVLKLYTRITKCFYNEKLKEKQVNALAGQARLLFDDELLANNPIDKYLLDLKVDITDYRDVGRTIMSYEIGENEDVHYWEKEDRKYATLTVTFTLKEGSKYSKTYEQFILRQDANEKWKILGWTLTDNPESN